MLTTVLDLAGFILITIAAFLLSTILGLAVAGACVLFVSWKLA